MKLMCAKCEQEKDSSQFANGEQRRKGYRRCRVCVSEDARRWREKNPGYVANRTPEQQARYLATQRERNATRDQRVRNADAWFRYRYGLTLAEVDAMIQEQGGVCAICYKPETKVDP